MPRKPFHGVLLSCWLAAACSSPLGEQRLPEWSGKTPVRFSTPRSIGPLARALLVEPVPNPADVLT
jgi:hypothetical protein